MAVAIMMTRDVSVGTSRYVLGEIQSNTSKLYTGHDLLALVA